MDHMFKTEATQRPYKKYFFWHHPTDVTLTPYSLDALMKLPFNV